MPKINEKGNKFYWVNKIGFFIILALPVLIAPPYFFPADWGKSIVFRTILSILSILFIYQVFYKKNTIPGVNIKNNKLVWAMMAYFTVFLLASIFSVDPGFSFWGSPFRGGGFINLGFCFVYALLVFIFFRNNDWKKAWIFSFFIGIIVSGLAIIQYYGIFSSFFIPKSEPSSTMGNPIPLAVYLLLLSFIVLSFAIKEPFNTTQNKTKKIFYIASLVIFLFTILISSTRAAYLGITIGAVYFLLFYPKKLKVVKIYLTAILAIIFVIVLYANIHPELPKFLQNRVTQEAVRQLSIKQALSNERFSAWKIMINEIKDRPILGWGPENLAVGFDKNYDSNITPSPWWDRAHNIFLDAGVQAGILGLIAQIALFAVLLWQLQKAKRNEENSLICHGLQTAIIGYLVAGFFSLNTLSIDIILFLIIGYSLYLSRENKIEIENDTKKYEAQKGAWWKSLTIFLLFCFLIIFLWQYNFIPLQINAELNYAEDLANHKNCTASLALMDEALLKHSFLDSYARTQYIEREKTCSEFYPQNALAYTTRALEILKEAVKINPLYTRYWIDLGELTTTMVDQENDIVKKDALVKEVRYYFDKALQLAPKHQEIFTDMVELEIVLGDYKSAKDYSRKCMSINPNIGDCYFYMAISEIYARDIEDGKINLQKAENLGVDLGSSKKLLLLSNAYGSIPDYQDMATVVERLIAAHAREVNDALEKNLKIGLIFAQYHSTLAFLYAKMGQYDKARQEALTVLKLSPESEQNVNEFLKTLP